LRERRAEREQRRALLGRRRAHRRVLERAHGLEPVRPERAVDSPDARPARGDMPKRAQRIPEEDRDRDATRSERAEEPSPRLRLQASSTAGVSAIWTAASSMTRPHERRMTTVETAR
jgi:hypothetical protein